MSLTPLQRDAQYARNKAWHIRNPEKSWKIRTGAGKRYSHLRGMARKRGLELGISRELFSEIIKNPCTYCGVSLANSVGHCLDRLNNSAGYVPGNVVPCCGDCNHVRNSILTPQEMLAAMKAVKQVRLRNAAEQLGQEGIWSESEAFVNLSN